MSKKLQPVANKSGGFFFTIYCCEIIFLGFLVSLHSFYAETLMTLYFRPFFKDVFVETALEDERECFPPEQRTSVLMVPSKIFGFPKLSVPFL